MINDLLKTQFIEAIDFSPIEKMALKKQEPLPVDYFEFYKAISSVYSSKIEGEDIDFDSFFKHKFLNVPYLPDYTKKAEDLFQAYTFIQKEALTPKNVIKAHKIMCKHLLPKNQRGKIRTNPMFVLNEEDRIEYIACEPQFLKKEWNTFFKEVGELLKRDLSVLDTLFYAAQIHLIFVKIHPMQDVNGRTARLLEKWFLLQKIGEDAIAIGLEKNYYKHRTAYYKNIRKIGLEYQHLDYSKSLDFLQMTVNSLK